MTDTLRPMTADDWPAVKEIYGQGITMGDATFETRVPSWEHWNTTHLKHCRLVAEVEGRVAGWAALNQVSPRPVYAGVTEVSVYVDEAARGRGLGRALLEGLIEHSERAGIWTLQAGIFPENQLSIGLHERCGFRVMGRRERVGQMHGRWRDVIVLERRSPVVGTP